MEGVTQHSHKRVAPPNFGHVAAFGESARSIARTLLTSTVAEPCAAMVADTRARRRDRRRQ